MRDVEVPDWLKELRLAPVFRPTYTEFADPIAYISKIEKEAGQFGICKIIPPLLKPSRKYVFNNINKSLSKFSTTNPLYSSNIQDSVTGSVESDGKAQTVFTTRQQQLGHFDKKIKGSDQSQNPVFQMQVWESGELYTLERFESKSKMLARGILGVVKDVSPLVVETMFWQAVSDMPIYVEYANDVPGSGFGEPKELFQFFHGQKTKGVNRKIRHKKDYRRSKMDIMKYPCHDINENTSTSSQTSSLSDPASTSSSKLEISHDYEQRFHDANESFVGTSGWKLSNSPWNLQIISRSSGSLTRFMPDNIPGVTSPMVYIGMIFSWFAWHVEDHELHSLNFLHTGAPKTWYAVPGEYAFAFEQVIRTQVYGSNLDHFAALALLGKKTTLLPPEVIIRSGIPCCRLVQHPGEYVVTFPRAYHVGFSHGFNCGEAANFCTPEWLKVAKEAAVRRAAMDYLPMLSHQQLLYVLAMSFISRIPRSLLPGARSSRFRDLQKVERELSVKIAFIEDFLSENNLTSTLLQRDSTCRAVIWNPELLPSFSKESQLRDRISGCASETENPSYVSYENDANATNLFEEMTDPPNEMYMNDVDACSDFEVVSGPLPCVACGLLGFPFMSILQPSEKASRQFSFTEFFSNEDSSSISASKKYSGWNLSNVYFRPRILCMEHAVEAQQLLHSKGGAKILVICHSDCVKMKACASVVAEEVGRHIEFHDIDLHNATPEDLNLIDLAVDEQCHGESNDWTTELGFNLRHCVSEIKKNPQKNIKRTLSLCGLLSATTTMNSNLKWQSSRSRSKLFKKSRKEMRDKPTSEVTMIKYSRRKREREHCCEFFRREETENDVKKETGRQREVNQHLLSDTGFIKSPCEGLRRRDPNKPSLRCMGWRKPSL